MVRGRVLKVGQLHHQLVGEGIGGPMTTVVHHQRTVGHLLFDLTGGLGIGITRGRGGALEGIPVDFLQQIAGIVILHQGGNTVGSGHVGVAVAIVTHHTDDILPGTCIRVGGIVQRLVCQYLRLFRRPGRIAAYCHIRLS